MLCRVSELRGSPDSKSFSRRGSGVPLDPDKAELDRERRELRQMRAELERRVAEFDKRQVHLMLLFQLLSNCSIL